MACATIPALGATADLLVPELARRGSGASAGLSSFVARTGDSGAGRPAQGSQTCLPARISSPSRWHEPKGGCASRLIAALR